MAKLIDEKETQKLRWEIVGGGLAVGVVLLLLWAEAKTEIPPVPQGQ